MSKRFVLKPLVVASALAVVGAVAPVAAETLTVELTDYNADARSYITNKVIPAFEAAHPGVEVDIVTASWSSLLEKITTWYAAGQQPDVMQVGAQYIGLLAPQGLIMPIDRFARNWSDLADFPQVEIEDVSYNGQIYAIPYRLDQRGFLYRKDIFAENGLDPNRPPKTWDELASFAKKLTILDSSGQFEQSGFRVDNNVQRFTLFLFQAGGRFISKDLHKVIIDSPEAIQAAQFYSDLVNIYHVSPPGGHGGLTSSGLAMEYTGASPISHKEQGVEIGAALPPKGPVSNAGAVWINKWVVGAQSKHPELAWAWIKYLSEPDVMAEVGRLANLMPPRFAMLRYEPWASDPRWKVFFDTVGITPAFRAQVPTSYEFIHHNVQPFTRLLDDILNNRKSPSVAFHELADVEQSKLDEFWRQYGE